MTIPLKRAEVLLDAFASQRVVILGDLMLDRYVHGSVDRISPEAPVPVVKVGRDRSVPGGACNVASNVVALGADAALCGVVGRDRYGEDLLGLLSASGVDCRGMAVVDGVETVVKTRVLADQQQVCRVDREADDHAPYAVGEVFLKQVGDAMVGATGAVVEDYGKGVIQPVNVRLLIDEAQRLGIPVGYDPKENHAVDVRGITVATPNRKEAFYMSGLVEGRPVQPPMEDVALAEVAARLRAAWEPELLMLTLGPDGVLLADDGGLSHVPTRARAVYDVSGAGDTVIAVCVLALAAGASHAEAAELANYAAGVVVGVVGTATCRPEDILQAIRLDQECG